MDEKDGVGVGPSERATEPSRSWGSGCCTGPRLWRAVDQDGLVLDVLVQSRRDKRAAKRLLRKLLKRQGRPPRVLVTELLWLQSKAA